MVDILLSILKALGTSFFAVLVIGLAYTVIVFPLIRTRLVFFLTENKQVTYVIYTLLIFGLPIAFSLMTGDEFLSVSLNYVRELILSVIIAATLWVTWALTENPTGAKRAFFVALLHTLVNVERRSFFGGLQALFRNEKALDFFAIEHSRLKKILTVPVFNKCLNICEMTIVYQPISQELKLYDNNNPEDCRYIPFEDNALLIPLAVAISSLQNNDVSSGFQALYDVSLDFQALQDLLRLGHEVTK